MSEGPRRFTKRPVTIEAMQFNGRIGAGGSIVEWIQGSGGSARLHDVYEMPTEGYVPLSKRFIVGGIHIDTLEGVMNASAGDWIIKGVQGEFYPCKPDIFDATYVPAED